MTRAAAERLRQLQSSDLFMCDKREYQSGLPIAFNKRDKVWNYGSGTESHLGFARLDSPPQTRGDLRRLAQALGITLTEPA